jgi:TetR/AcrR family transcriptional repressor of nem operon
VVNQTARKRASGDAAPRLTARGRATRERIVAAASALMLQQGVARTTIEDIQLAAEVSASQMYHYFTDKADLVSAVVDFQTDQVLDFQHQGLDSVNTLDDLRRWRDLVVDTTIAMQCAGGCPIGSLASDLSETDPVARAQLARSFARWETLLHDGLSRMRDRGELPATADTGQLALSLLAAVQGGLLLSQVRRDVAPLRAVLNSLIDHIASLCAGAPAAAPA